MTDIGKAIEIMDDLEVKQMILQGPPGTSKTWSAMYEIVATGIEYNKLISELGTGTISLEKKRNIIKKAEEEIAEKDITKIEQLVKDYRIKEYTNETTDGEEIDVIRYWDMVQFHPSYGYEDFVRGITVTSDENNNIKYETLDKVFGNICKLAKPENNSNKKYFLIIDEINRADIASVFGELIYALENRGKQVTIPYALNGKDYSLTVPENLYIIGTMNTADKSIGNIDYAIRRRFLFFDCLPDEEVLKKYYKRENHFAINSFNNIKNFIKENLDEKYKEKDIQIGHTYFMIKSFKNEDEMKYKLQYQILPILREYIDDGILVKKKDDDNICNKIFEYSKGKTEDFDIGDFFNLLKS